MLFLELCLFILFSTVDWHRFTHFETIQSLAITYFCIIDEYLLYWIYFSIVYRKWHRDCY